MTRWAWLAVLPYVVVADTEGYFQFYNAKDEPTYSIKSSLTGKEMADDLAAALNDAHERRIHPNGMITNTQEIVPGEIRDDMPCVFSPMFPCK